MKRATGRLDNIVNGGDLEKGLTQLQVNNIPDFQGQVIIEIQNTSITKKALLDKIDSVYNKTPDTVDLNQNVKVILNGEEFSILNGVLPY